jgi:signal transduction histidine kinase
MLKFLELNSIRSRMVSGFLFLTLLILLLAFVSLYMLDRTGRIANIHGKISQLEVFTLSLIKSDNDFFGLETINEVYFKTHRSPFLVRRDSLLARINADVIDVVRKSEHKSYSVGKNLEDIGMTLALYNQTFKELEILYFKKGFKDYGLEGAMRVHAHKLEEPASGIEVSRILYLRKNEKDFFLRHDIQYLHTFNELSDKVVEDLSKNQKANEGSIAHVKEYRHLFNEIVAIQGEIGLTSDTGLRSTLANLTTTLSNQYFSLAEYSYTLSSAAQRDARIFYIIVLGGAFIFSVFSAYWISKRLSEPIARLSRLMNTVMATKSSTKIDFTLNNAAHEINTLTNSFIRLMDQTNIQMKEIKSKSKLLKKRNGELKKLNEELDSFLYSTAHDLRSPLSSLLGLLGILQLENKQRELRVHFDLMEKSIHRMESFIAQIVNYSKNKRLKIAPEKLDLRILISEIFENHRFVEGANRIEKHVDIKDAFPFFSDRNRIIILFNNLISNAIRYSDPQRENPYIRIAVGIDRNEAIIEFIDNGVGIGEEHMGKIFDMFYRANVDSKGSGLGLFIFKETVERLKGVLSVQSTLGSGTKFFIKIPNLSDEGVLQLELIKKPVASTS